MDINIDNKFSWKLCTVKNPFNSIDSPKTGQESPKKITSTQYTLALNYKNKLTKWIQNPAIRQLPVKEVQSNLFPGTNQEQASGPYN